MATRATEAGTSKSVMDRHAHNMTAIRNRYFCLTLNALTCEGRAMEVRLPSHLTRACPILALNAASIGIAIRSGYSAQKKLLVSPDTVQHAAGASLEFCRPASSYMSPFL